MRVGERKSVCGERGNVCVKSCDIVSLRLFPGSVCESVGVRVRVCVCACVCVCVC